MLSYSYTRLFIPTCKMYTTSDLRSISHVHAVFALPSVPRVYISDTIWVAIMHTKTTQLCTYYMYMLISDMKCDIKIDYATPGV